jgi:hypothetical protein
MRSNPCRPYATYVHVGSVTRAGSQRWPIRAVTGTMAQQERDDETGCSVSRSLVGSGPRQADRNHEE